MSQNIRKHICGITLQHFFSSMEQKTLCLHKNLKSVHVKCRFITGEIKALSEGKLGFLLVSILGEEISVVPNINN